MRKNRMGRVGSPAAWRALWAGLAAALLAGPVSAAEVFEKVGTYDAQFLKIGIGARATGMGGAYAAVGDDPTSVFWNAAGIAGVADGGASMAGRGGGEAADDEPRTPPRRTPRARLAPLARLAHFMGHLLREARSVPV